MITEMHKSDIPPLGTPFGGGFAVVTYRCGGNEYLQIDAGKAGELRGIYGARGQLIEGANSYTDGRANTVAMASAGSKLAKQALDLRIGGYADWGIYARDQLELAFRYFKPTDDENWCSFRDGENPSALPPTYPYTKQDPVQTAIESYRAGGENAFLREYYLASTQYSAGNAWVQHFDYGVQGTSGKISEFAARVGRRILIIQ